MPLPEPLLQQWRLSPCAAVRTLEITEEGILLGKTILAPFVKGNLFIDRPRILAMLSVAYCREAPRKLFDACLHAERDFKKGDKVLSNMHLALVGLEPLDLEIAQRLFACDWGLKRGITVPMLLKIAGMEKFNPYHLGPGPGGRQFTTAELNGASAGIQMAQNESSGIDGYDRNRPWDFPTPQVFLPVIPEGLMGEGAAAAGARTAAQSESTIKELLMPGGSRIGRAGTSGDIRIIKGTVQDAQALFSRLTQGGKILPDARYSGVRMSLPNGGTVSIRTFSTASPNTAATIDVEIANIPIDKIKFNP